MSKRVAVFFTAESIEAILRKGGTSAWRLDVRNARHCVYAICARNTRAEPVKGNETHLSGFIVGKISGVVPAPGYQLDQRRFIVLFSEYAVVNISNIWKGDRNPVRYSTDDELGISLDDLEWTPMPPGPAEDAPRETGGISVSEDAKPARLTIDEAKKGLAATFGVRPEAIEIVIRG